jgi:hypothetical protein
VDATIKELAGFEDYERVFERYLEVCNQAIEKNRDKFPYMEIWKARWKKLSTGNILQCALYDDRPKVVYTLRLAEDMKIEIIEKTHMAPKEAWPLRYSFLKHVADNPEDYIEHPANLDWGWLTDMFG